MKLYGFVKLLDKIVKFYMGLYKKVFKQKSCKTLLIVQLTLSYSFISLNYL